MWALVVAAVIVTIIAIQVVIILATAAFFLAAAIVCGIAYAVYYVVAKPDNVPVILEESARTVLRYLTHFYFYIPFTTAGFLIGLFVRPWQQPTGINGLELALYNALFLAAMGLFVDVIIGWFGNWARGMKGWSFVSSDWFYQIPPVIHDQYGSRKVAAFDTAREVCQRKLEELARQHPEWEPALSRISFKTEMNTEYPELSLCFDGETLPSDIPDFKRLLGEIHQAADFDVRLTNGYLVSKPVKIDSRGVPKNYWEACDNDECSHTSRHWYLVGTDPNTRLSVFLS